MVTVTAKPINIEGTIDSTSTLDFMLCGYGSQIPRAHGSGNSVGTFVNGALTGVQGEVPEISIQLIGNDVIDPPNTYYTVTTRNGNGDVLQVNAYRFEDGSTYNLDFATPIDPDQPPPPLPPTTGDQLDQIPYSPTPDFDGSVFTSWEITLAGDVNSSTISGCVPGNLYTFIIHQDGTGGHAFAWPANVNNPAPINPGADSSTLQTFVADDNAALWAIGPGTYYP
jgi:hypothetical protein